MAGAGRPAPVTPGIAGIIPTVGRPDMLRLCLQSATLDEGAGKTECHSDVLTSVVEALAPVLVGELALRLALGY